MHQWHPLLPVIMPAKYVDQTESLWNVVAAVLYPRLHGCGLTNKTHIHINMHAHTKSQGLNGAIAGYWGAWCMWRERKKEESQQKVDTTTERFDRIWGAARDPGPDQ